MKLLRTFPIMAFTLVLLSIASFCATKGFVGFLILTGAIAALSWYVCEGPRGLALPRFAANMLILVASIAVLPDIVSHPNDMIGVLGRFTVWLVLIKLYERKSPRDYAQLLWLSLILMVAGTLETTEFLFAIALLCYSILGIYVLLLFQLYQSYINSFQDRYKSDLSGQRLLPSLRPVLGRTVKGQFITTSTILCVIGLLLSIVIFLAYPRNFGQGMFSRLTYVPIKNKTGFVNEISLTSSLGQRITDSKSPVFTVKLTNHEGIPVEHPGPLYLRGAALDFYDPEHASWKKAPTPTVTMYRGVSEPDDFTTVVNDATEAQKVILNDIEVLQKQQGSLEIQTTTLQRSINETNRVIDATDTILETDPNNTQIQDIRQKLVDNKNDLTTQLNAVVVELSALPSQIEDKKDDLRVLSNLVN